MGAPRSAHLATARDGPRVAAQESVDGLGLEPEQVRELGDGEHLGAGGGSGLVLRGTPGGARRLALPAVAGVGVEKREGLIACVRESVRLCIRELEALGETGSADGRIDALAMVRRREEAETLLHRHAAAVERDAFSRWSCSAIV